MAAFVPGFENDLFLSYAHDDDCLWIRAFEKSLGEQVSRRLGLKVKVWQDEKRIRAGANWKNEIDEAIARSAALVAVVSPSYRDSNWCGQERTAFIRRFPSFAEFESSSRFFKAVKTAWEDDGHLQFLPVVQDVNFFSRDVKQDQMEFVPESPEFKRAVGELAASIAERLLRLRRSRERVYVAHNADCLDIWTELAAELQSQCYDVQPTGPRGLEYAKQRLLGEMAGAVLSIHLLGKTYDEFREHLVTLAAEQGQRLLFSTAVGAETTDDERQRLLIEALRNGHVPGAPGRTLPAGWSWLREVNPRKLIDEVLAALRPVPSIEAPAPQNGNALVYIVHDATNGEDTRIALTLKDQIREREKAKMDIFLSKADAASPGDLRRRHESLLRSCDGVLLCRSAAPQGWFNQLAPEVMAIDRLTDRKPLKSRAFLLGPPAKWSGAPDLNVIPYSPQFKVADLDPFLGPLRH